MFYYNPKDWVFAIFRIPKSDTFRTLLPALLFVLLYSWAIVYVEKEYLKLTEDNNAKNITIMHTLLGFAISMLLVFRTNTAYDRWWEGRKLWGNLVNNSRNLAIKLQAILPDEDNGSRVFFKEIIPMFAFALQKHLQKESTLVQLDENSTKNLSDSKSITHLPNEIAQSIIHKVNSLYMQKTISGSQMWMLNEQLTSLTDICGSCERIKNTPIPFSYSAFIKKFIFFYVITLPIGLAFTLGYIAIPVTAFIFYILASLELIAEEIEDPFGTDANDLPMEKIAQNIQENVQNIIKI
jgi:putative membrane protein